MRRNLSSFLSDGAFLALFLLSFLTIVYIGGDPDQYLRNIIFLNVAFLIAIITYFTNVTTGLIINILFLFGYGTFTLYRTAVTGGVVELQTYFWLIMTPIYTLTTWLLTYANKAIQAENARLKKATVSLATMDEHTNLKNIRSFQKDATIFMALSKRYQIPLTLVVANVKYWDEIKQMISEDQMTEAIFDVSSLSQTTIRTNDSLYMLNSNNPTWGMLLFTDREGANIVIDRLRDKVEDLNMQDYAGRFSVELDLRIGAVEYDETAIESPLDFISQARKQLEYDV
ncbi:diguanylate cyclase domain-containing protein [Paenibacillus gansuensis]|uniref:Diguanylate cyclase domain-containing protein n=1 Tax=Paenibacillus gansuensis TaxID=306542 RepID=A0ABW5PJ47_9BACL